VIVAVGFLGVLTRSVWVDYHDDKTLIIIPAGYRGYFFIVKSHQVPVEEYDSRGFRIYRIPISGLCYTPRTNRFFDFQTYEARDTAGNTISMGWPGWQGPGVAISNTGSWGDDSVVPFFVGTSAELRLLDDVGLANKIDYQRRKAAAASQGSR
jgi:hypothetical protein